jgi:peptidase E
MSVNKIKPVFLMSGGRSSRQGKKVDTAMRAILEATACKAPSIGYVGAASDDDRSFFKLIAAELIKAGASEVVHALIAPAKADLVKARSILEKADAVFISGGDVERGMQVLEEKNMGGFLKDLHQQGKLFFGASAGSIMLAREWVRWQDPEDDASAELFPCLGFAGVICDTHSESDGWEELQAALSLEKSTTTGYGITTGACLKVDPTGTLEAFGEPVNVFQNQAGKVLKQPDILPV